MCDYSLHNVKTRPAKVSDKLTTRPDVINHKTAIFRQINQDNPRVQHPAISR